MAMPEFKWKPKAMTREEHQDYISQVVDIMKDLDHTLRCYYISLGDDAALTEDDKIQFLKHAFQEGLKAVGVNCKAVMFHGS